MLVEKFVFAVSKAVILARMSAKSGKLSTCCCSNCTCVFRLVVSVDKVILWVFRWSMRASWAASVAWRPAMAAALAVL